MPRAGRQGLPPSERCWPPLSRLAASEEFGVVAESILREALRRWHGLVPCCHPAHADGGDRADASRANREEAQRPEHGPSPRMCRAAIHKLHATAGLPLCNLRAAPRRRPTLELVQGDSARCHSRMETVEPTTAAGMAPRSSWSAVGRSKPEALHRGRGVSRKTETACALTSHWIDPSGSRFLQRQATIP